MSTHADATLISYLVLPPGHGKSYLHNSLEGLVGVDDIHHCRSNEQLSSLRDEAKRTGDWAAYDHQYSSEISAKLTSGRWVVMVPSHDLGRLIGQTCLGSAVLAKQEWEKNFDSRKDSPSKHVQCWEIARDKGAFIFQQNHQISTFVIGQAHGWLNSRSH